MTEPRDLQAKAAHPELEVGPEVIEDLDVMGVDADNIAGGTATGGSRGTAGQGQ